MERYDTAIVGAGPEGLTAAILLARAGLRVVVLERAPQPGQIAATVEFHPGFRVSPYADELAPIPQRLFWEFDLARQGVFFVPRPASICVTGSGVSTILSGRERAALLLGGVRGQELASLENAVDAVIAAMADTPPESASRAARWFSTRGARAPVVDGDWMSLSLDSLLRHRIEDAQLRLHLAAEAVSGRTVAPYDAGTALHLLAPGTGCSGLAAGGLGRLGNALADTARAHGVAIRCNADAEGLVLNRRRVSGVVLADGDHVQANTVLSVLDLKRSAALLANIPLSSDVARRIQQFRMHGQRARVLFALRAVPRFSFARDLPEAARGPVHVLGSMDDILRAHESWRAGLLDEALPVTLRVPSLTDPSLAPPGQAVMTATLSAVPYRLFSGPWTAAARARLVSAALAAAERVSPGVSVSVLDTLVVVPPDIESTLGLTAGDIEGGEIAPDQVMDFRPLPEWRDGRTSIPGFYLGGPSSSPAPFLCGAAGARAARALISDLSGARR